LNLLSFNSFAIFLTLLLVQSKDDSGSPLVEYSIRSFNTGKIVGLVSVIFFRPPPSSRILSLLRHCKQESLFFSSARPRRRA
jgi:hypothetical protein